MRRVLFICTANQCRSAAAAAILEQIARDAGLELEVASAGTHAVDGIPAQQSTIEAAWEAGFDLRGHRSQSVTRDLLDWADVVLAMTRGHVGWLLQVMPPQSTGRVRLFKPYCEGKFEDGSAPSMYLEDEILDPIGMPDDEQRVMIAEMRRLLQAMVDRWRRKGASP